MRLTVKSIAALKPTASEVIHWDDTLPGLGLRVHPTGRKVWLLRYRTDDGVQRKLTLGQAEVVPPDMARDLAREALVKVQQGGDPARERQKKRETMTFRELHEAYLASRVGKAKPQSLKIYRSYMRHHLDAAVGGMPITRITPMDLQELHAAMAETPFEANRCLQYVKACMNFAERMKLIPRGTNPAYDVEKYRERPRQTVMRPEQLQALWAVLDTYTSRTPSAPYLLKVLLLTGLRWREWSSARWEWLDLIDGVLKLPDSKSGARDVVLSQATLNLLRSWRSQCRGPWIFPNEHGDNHITHLFRHWQKACRLAGLSGLRIHDIRHTVGSLSHLAGLSQKQVADLLGHRDMRTTARYIGAASTMREAAEVAAQAMAVKPH